MSLRAWKNEQLSKVRTTRFHDVHYYDVGNDQLVAHEPGVCTRAWPLQDRVVLTQG